MNHIGLFEGIGGFSIAAKWIGWETIAWCEINPFCQTVLKYHFPNAQPHSDIKQTDFTIYRGQCDIITGGFPCQPYSVAGKQLGTADDRHLWPEMLRAIREVKPTWVVGENVRGLINWNGGMVFDQVQADLEAQGYEVLPLLLPACAVNAPHRRDRIWFVAYARYNSKRPARNSNSNEGAESSFFNSGLRNLQRSISNSKSSRLEGANGIFLEKPSEPSEPITPHSSSDGHELRGFGEDRSTQTEGETTQDQRQWFWGDIGGACEQESSSNTNLNQRCEGRMHTNTRETERHISTFGSWNFRRAWQNFPTKSPVCGRNDGIPRELDAITFPKWRNESIKAYGNAVVPQIPYLIFKAIIQLQHESTIRP